MARKSRVESAPAVPQPGSRSARRFTPGTTDNYVSNETIVAGLTAGTRRGSAIARLTSDRYHPQCPCMTREKRMNALQWLTLMSTLGSGLVAGFFFAFSICVMSALAKIPAPQGIAAMQSINIVVINPWFFTAFFGTAILCLAAIVASVSRWDDPRALYWLAGGVIYLVGVIGVTMRFNVPLNNALAALASTSPEAAKLWARYLSTWTNWNHVRTIGGLLAAVLFALALRR
jgi:uncharacterized membrane protein